MTAKRSSSPPERAAGDGPSAADGVVDIHAVARQAGVSIATVSRVFTGKGPVRESTRERVLEVARRLRYSPHPAARSLSARRTDTLGVVLPDLYGGFYSELLRGLDVAARREGFHLLVSGSHSDPAEVSAVLAALSGRVDGLVLMFPDLDSATLPARLLDTPVLLLNCRVEGLRADTIRVANRQGAEEVVRHLLGLGHRRIAMIAGPDSNLDAVERRHGFLAALREAGVEPAVAPGHFTEESGHRAARELLAAAPRPTAIFAANDAMALGCLHAAHELGLRVPDDLALVGFDDIPGVSYVTPPLTTVHVPISELGERAVARLLAVLRTGEEPPREERLSVHLVVRQSCGARLPPRADRNHAGPAEGAPSTSARRRRP
jgi:LacI family transcriptional regulator